jgi:hypothetical protein
VPTWDGRIIENFITRDEAAFIMESLSKIENWNDFEYGHMFNSHGYKVIYQKRIKEQNEELYKLTVNIEHKLRETLINQWADMRPKQGEFYYAVRQPNHVGAPHRDADPVRLPGTEVIRYACVLYLNEDFEGGNLIYPEHGVEVPPRIGQLVIHDATYLHQILPWTGSARWTGLAFWTPREP